MAIRAYREPQNKSSGGCSTISVRSSSMSVVTAAAARSSIARQSARTWRPVAVSRAPPPRPPIAASISGSRKQAFMVLARTQARR